MNHIQLELPETLPFAVDLRVRVSDLNYGNHLGNDAVLSLVHEARMQFLRSLGLHELAPDGLGMVIADAAIVYRAQAFHGDILRIEVGVADVRHRACTFYYRVSQAVDGRLVAEARTGAVFYDFRRQTVRSLSDEQLTALRQSGNS